MITGDEEKTRRQAVAASNRRKGALGEDTALRYLQERGYILEGRNIHCRYGEIDLVVSRGDVLVFAEVKTRKEQSEIGAAESVTWQKQQRLRRCAELYIAKGSDRRQPRFDVLCVTLRRGQAPLVEHIENAF